MIRRPGTSDIKAVFAVERDVFGTHVYPDFFFRQALDLWGDTFFVADGENGALDGYVIGAPSHEPGVMWVLSLAVRGASRGRGIGKALMQEVLAAMKARGVASAKLTVHPDNRAVTLYQNLGFEVITKDPNYFGENDPRLVMELRFTGAPRSNPA
ncbi:N-acetyltransferase [Polyangium sp. 15x6]|uniref:GNAT family N-acetyltransferase n=1 Tax=Polyangium sp. 15x6 TaxID=3042687 RepID=UPI00249A3B65|nr:N-acetyltransferase [Polyangium sp. 15x6]MDI3287598.1 N-acetyltransferase [Polyangium sp. 15x6]